MKNKRNVISVRFLITILIMVITISSAMVLVGCSDSGGSSDDSSSSSGDPGSPSTKDDSVATPTANPAAGPMAVGSTVQLSTTTTGAEIWYTTNNATPAKDTSTKYSSSITLTTLPMTIKAIAVKDGLTDSAILTVTYTNAISITSLPLTIKAIAVKDGLTDSAILTANYAATGISVVNVNITGPAKGATPATTATSTEERFTAGTVTWSPNDNPFKANTVYTATVTLTAKPSYTFTGINNSNVKVGDTVATNISNTGTTLTLSHAFAKTGAKAITDIAIKEQPTKLSGYTHGDKLDLAGLEVTLTYDDDDTEDIALADFDAKDITTNPAQDQQLEYTTYNGKPVEISIGNVKVNTGNLSISKASFESTNTRITITGGLEDKPYTGTEISQGLSISYQGATSTRTLVEDTDFEVSYSNNINVGTATVTITGIGDYDGNRIATFDILKPFTHTTFVYAWENEHGDLATAAGSATTITKGTNLVFTSITDTYYTVLDWYVDGVAQNVTTATFTFSNTIVGRHYVTVVLKKDGLMYNTNIEITVTEE